MALIKNRNDNTKENTSKSVENPSLNENCDVNNESEKLGNKRKASKILQGPKQKKRKCFDEIGDIGIIDKVTLQNFMCHSNLEFSLDPHLNFITGRNGSGKSAVLTGIILALGGHSAATGRASNTSGFIQTGKQSACITVTLRNTGIGAYLPNKFGSRIVVERKLLLNGQGLYKLKSAAGKIVSTKKEDLNNIMRAFNIHVDNPISILTQNTSKCFLISKDVKDPKRKYELYFKATQLERLKNDIDNLVKKKDRTSSNLQSKIKAIKDAGKEIKQLLRMQKRHSNIDHEKKKLKALKTEKLSANVRDLKLNEKSIEDEMTNVKKKLKTLQDNVGACEKTIEDFDKSLIRLKVDMCNLDKEKGEKYEKHKDILKQIQNLRNEIKLKEEMKLKEIKENKKKAGREIVLLQKQIDKCNEESQQTTAIEHYKRLQEISHLEKVKLQQKAILNEDEGKISQYRSTMMEMSESNYKLNQEHIKLNDKISSLNDIINKMRRSIKNRGDRFGTAISQLLSKIQAHTHQFVKMPVGPLGLYLKIKNDQWAFAVERCLSKQFLYTFCCDNERDAKLLKLLMTESFGNSKIEMPSIFTCRFTNEVYKDIQHVNPKDFDVVLDLLTSDNPVVMNCLIDVKAVESILLIGDQSTAMEVMMNRPPWHCICCYTLSGDLLYPSPNYRYYSCKIRAHNYSILQRYNQEDIQKMLPEHNFITTQLMNISVNKEKIKIQKKKYEDLISETKKRQHDTKTKIHKIEQQQKDLKENTINRPNISFYTEEKVGQENLRVKLETEEINMIKEIDEKKKKLAHMKNDEKISNEDFVKTRELWHMLEGQIFSTEKEKNTHSLQLVKYQAEEMEYLNQKQNLQKTLTEFSEKKKELDNTLNALEINPVETNKSVEDLKIEISQLQQAIDEQTNLVKEEIELLVNLPILQEQLIHNKREIKNLKMLMEHYEEELKLRQEKFTQIRKLISMRVNYSFQTHINMKGFVGHLKFDHKNCKLIISAEPRSQSKARKKMKISITIHSLSGGERSFVTVALLMALSDVSEMPFHILDEFDVFMDHKNKEEATVAMFEKAKQHSRKQYIFVSPSNCPSVGRKYDIKIHKMPDPERLGVPS